MSNRYLKVRRFTQGATWDDGSPRMCTRCAGSGRRRKQAVLTAMRRDGRFQLPVGYCAEHTPAELEKVSA